MSAYGTDETRILGHLDLTMSEADWSSLILCPSRYSTEAQDKHLIFSGSPNLSFTVQIDSSPQEIKLNEPQNVTVTPENVQVFQFFPPEDIAKTQLDVTVTSESADVPAYLKVSLACKDVEKDNIDELDKGESIRLSFAKKGRITLSKVSVPPLTDSTSSWFIGIAIKNATGDTPFNATKSVTLELNKSFDFSYALPVTLLVIIPTIVGFLISLWAYCCFGTMKAQNDVELSQQGEQHQQSQSNAATERDSLISDQKPITRCCFEAFSNWFKHGPKTYSYATGIVGFMLMIGAGQFVFANWHLMKDEGDRDNCYYNDFCYRVSEWHDIPFNLMISNLVYIIHGLILGVIVWFREAKWLTKTTFCAPAEQAFSIGYAFAWAMIFEGLFSLVYHLCPSKLTFQFDTAFMFVIAGLVVISLYNGSAQNPFGAANFFLYFLVPLFIFNYLGAVRHSEKGLPDPLKIFFFIALAAWFVGICSWTAVKLHLTPSILLYICNNVWQKARDPKLCKCDSEIVRKTFLFILGALCVVLPVTFFMVWFNNLPEVFLFSCIAESTLAIVIKYVSQCKCPELKWLLFFQISYLLVMVAFWWLALDVFVRKATTDKVETPEKSRNLNHNCYLVGFFDYHDLWHILSSHALLMTVYLVMFMSQE